MYQWFKKSEKSTACVLQETLLIDLPLAYDLSKDGLPIPPDKLYTEITCLQGKPRRYVVIE